MILEMKATFLRLAALIAAAYGGSFFQCENGWNNHKESCYQIFHATGGITFMDAAAACARKDALLTTVKDREEKEFLLDLASQYADKKSVYWSPWIGLATRNRIWMWEDGTAATSVAWGEGEPNNKETTDVCAHMINTRGKYFNLVRGDINDIRCNYALGSYICKNNAAEIAFDTTTTPSTTSSSTAEPTTTTSAATTPTTVTTTPITPSETTVTPSNTNDPAGGNYPSSASQCACMTSMAEPILSNSTSSSSTPFITFTRPDETVTSCTSSTVQMISTRSSTTIITSVITVTTTKKKENGNMDTIEAEKAECRGD